MASPGSRLDRGACAKEEAFPGGKRWFAPFNEFCLTPLGFSFLHRQEGIQPFVKLEYLALVQGHRRGQGRIECVFGIL